MKKFHLLFAFVMTVAASGQNINIPDANFKAKLLGNNSASFTATGGHPYTTADTNGDGEISVTEAAAVRGLKVYSTSSATAIQSMEGLQYFTNLKRLWCSDNHITTLDLSMMPQLESVMCEDNGLTSLTLPNTGSVTSITAYENDLTTFDTSHLPNLTYLEINGNNLSTIDLAPLVLLTYADISDNPISALNLSANSVLQRLFASGTLLQTIDCSLTAVEQLYCNDNPDLTSINIKNNKFSYTDPDMLLYGTKFENLPLLTSICIDNGEEYNLNHTNYNSGGNAVVYTGPNCDVVVNVAAGITDNKKATVKLYPNPAVNNLTIESTDSTLNSVEIINSLGQRLQSHSLSEGQNQFDVSGLAGGTYYLKMISERGTSTGKFIKM